MNSRRRIAPPRLRTGIVSRQLSTRKGGEPMSVLGHKQTYALQKAMSALPLIATTKADIRKRSCLLYPQERTCAAQLGMSAMGQKRTSRLIRSARPRGRLTNLGH